MEATGRLQAIQKDWQTDKWLLTFEINEKPTEEINFIKDCEKLILVIKKFRKKRSLDANAYCWALITEIANHPDVRSSKEEIYEEMLQKYGFLDQDESGYITITARADIDVKRLGSHWKFYKSNGKFNAYLAIKGTSEYDTAEMAHFIDQVVSEAKELGIETATPDEIARMKALWGVENG